MNAQTAPGLRRLSDTMGSVLVELAKRHERQQTIRHLELQIAELNARRAFHLDPTHNNLTTWCNTKEALEASK